MLTDGEHMTTSRGRFLQTLAFQPADPPWARWGLYVWTQTESLWRQQGWDGRPFHDVFELDRLLRVDPFYGPLPLFERVVLAEDGSTITYVGSDGTILREFKEHSDSSMPHFVKFPVASEADFEAYLRDHGGLQPELRFTPEWARSVAAGAEVSLRDEPPAWASWLVGSGSGAPAGEEWPRLCWADRWGGFFGPLRNLTGLEGLCFALYDQPRLVERMMAQRAEAVIAITEEVLKRTSFEVFWFWEDMAYNGGSLVNPALFRKLALPHYRRICDWLRSRGIQHIGLDSDGNISQLIPLWLEAGITMLWPFEVAAGMDVLQVRRTYGHDLAIMGGIDKRAVARGGQEMRREVDRVMPLVEDGGYIPEVDHGAPPDISWPAFCDYMAYLKKRLGWG
jgi:hypothetical protein